MRMRAALAAGLALAVWTATTVPAGAVTFYGSETMGGYTYSAEASFSMNGAYLEVLLANTAAEVKDPAGVLTCLFFDLAGDPVLSPYSVTLGAGSSMVLNNVVQSFDATTMNQQWAFRSGVNDTRWAGARYGVAAAGMAGVFGPTDSFASQGGVSPDGVGYGVVSAEGTADQGGLKRDVFARNSVLIRLLAPQGYTLRGDSVSNVWFQYGSAPTENSVQAVPEPFTMGALGAALVAAVFRRRR